MNLFAGTHRVGSSNWLSHPSRSVSGKLQHHFLIPSTLLKKVDWEKFSLDKNRHKKKYGFGNDGGYVLVPPPQKLTYPLKFGGWKIEKKMPFEMVSFLGEHVNPVGGFNPSEKYWSNWIISPGRDENQKYVKTPPRVIFRRGFLETSSLQRTDPWPPRRFWQNRSPTAPSIGPVWGPWPQEIDENHMLPGCSSTPYIGDGRPPSFEIGILIMGI